MGKVLGEKLGDGRMPCPRNEDSPMKPSAVNFQLSVKDEGLGKEDDKKHDMSRPDTQVRPYAKSEIFFNPEPET
jgi:hypothetical protein